MKLAKPKGLRLLDLLEQHVTLCANSVMLLDNIIKERFKSNFNEKKVRHLIGQLFKTEKEADKIRRSIAKELAKDIIPPLSREDLMKLTERLDIIADLSKDVSRFILVLGDIKIDSDFYNKITLMSKKVAECVNQLKSCIYALMEDLNKAIELSFEVEHTEEVVDELYVRCLKSLIHTHASCPETFIIAEIIKKLEKIADFCEDTSDMVKVIAVRGSI